MLQGFHAFEVQKECLFAFWADPRNGVQGRSEQFPAVNGLIVGDSKAVSFIPQSLKKMQGIGSVGEKERVLPAGNVDFFVEPPSFGTTVVLTLFGQGNHGEVSSQFFFFKKAGDPVQVPFAAIQHQ